MSKKVRIVPAIYSALILVGLFRLAIMILFFYSNFLAAVLKMANLTVIGLYFSLETVILWEISYENEDVSIFY